MEMKASLNRKYFTMKCCYTNRHMYVLHSGIHALMQLVAVGYHRRDFHTIKVVYLICKAGIISHRSTARISLCLWSVAYLILGI